MPQELTHQERAELERLLQEVFAEREVQTLLTVFERLRLPSGSHEVGQELRNLQTQVMEGQRSLQAALEQLAQAQARTEARVGNLEAALERLAQAQARTEEHLSELRQAQARTEARVGNLEAALERLAQAQGRTEEHLDELRQAQVRTDESIKELAQAQSRTEGALQHLARQVGGLSETVGGDIEDIAYIVLHDVLGREFGWQVGVLERTWQQWNGQGVELDIFGQAQDPGPPERQIWIVGEAKHNLTLREVERFARQVVQSREHLDGEVFAVCFCYRARPEVRARLQELGIRLVFSYGRLV